MTRKLSNSKIPKKLGRFHTISEQIIEKQKVLLALKRASKQRNRSPEELTLIKHIQSSTYLQLKKLQAKRSLITRLPSLKQGIAQCEDRIRQLERERNDLQRVVEGRYQDLTALLAKLNFNQSTDVEKSHSVKEKKDIAGQLQTPKVGAGLMFHRRSKSVENIPTSTDLASSSEEQNSSGFTAT